MKITTLILYSFIYFRHVMSGGVELEDLKRVMGERQPRLFGYYDRLCDENRFGVPSFGIELDEVSIFRKVANLQLPSDAPPIIIEEVADRFYWDRGLKSFSIPARLGQSRVNLFTSLYEIAFEASDLVFDELRTLLAPESEGHVTEFEFGQAPTYPLIADFIRAISSNPAHDMERIKKDLIAHYENISKALTQGRPYDIIAISLQEEVYFWILNYPLLIKNNVEPSKILCNMYALCGSRYFPVFRQRVLDILDQIKGFFVPLSRLPEEVATEKLLLMVGFPQYATYIYEHTSAEALKFIFGKNLTAWRAEIANSLEWEGILTMGYLPFMCLGYKNSYYDGYWINSKFDDLIDSLGPSQLLALFNGEDREIFIGSIRQCMKRVVMEERLGTVYSILQEEFGLVGPINPLNEEVDNNFEEQVIMILSGKHDGWNFWLGQKYLNNNNVLMSRLAFHRRYDMHDYLCNSFRDDKSKFINTIQDIYFSIVKTCSLPENLTLSARIEERHPSNYYSLFDMVLDDLIEHCVPEVCIPSILNYLDGDKDLVTSKLLLILLKGIAWKHFPGAGHICFDCFSEELKDGLLSFLGIKQELYPVGISVEASTNESPI